MPLLDPWILVAVLASALGGGAWWLGRRPAYGRELGVAVPGPPTIPLRSEPSSPAPLERLVGAFHAWFAQVDDEPQLWTSFDQLVRETLAEQIGATRVRCFHVRPGEDDLETIAQSGKPGAVPRRSVRAGLIGYVATSGRMFVAGDASHGALVDALARDCQDGWSCVWPIRERDVTTGLVAARVTPPEALPALPRLAALGQFLAVCWRAVAAVERARLCSRTDPGSGVLRRNDFFTLAQRTLIDAYAGNEPVVIACLGLEGLRRLDDAGAWQRRDALIERLGRLVQQRVRSDDLVGRFSDDRFVILLRRLDSQLAELIIATLLLAAEELLAELQIESRAVVVRGGLAGSGLVHKPLDELLTRAFESLDRARRAGRTLMTDLEPPPDTGAPA